MFNNKTYTTFLKNLFIYNTCFPIKYNKIINNTICTDNNIKIAFRIYNKNFNISDHIDYYHFINEKIIKKKKSPNFINMYGIYKDKDDRTIILTESSNINFWEWCSLQYKKNEKIYKMKIKGQYSTEIWMSILFQLFSALHILQKNNINIDNLSLKDNVFLKKINNNLKYWIYNINNINYYIPNNGYILYINLNDNKIFYNKNFLLNNIINRNMFSQTFLFNDGVKIPDKILNLLLDMYIYKDIFDISFFIEKYFLIYINNRIGTYLKDDEIDYIYKYVDRNFKKGDIITYKNSYGNDIFVMYLKGNDVYSEIICNSDIKKVATNTLNKYNAVEPILQNKKKINFSSESLLETYYC